MSAKIQTEHEVSTGKMLILHPDDVTVCESMRGRSKPPSKEAIEEIADSILAQGQIQPVTIRKLREGKYQLVAGFTRHAAVKLLCDQGKDTRLKCILTAVNDLEAFTINIAENNHRNVTSPIDDAQNQRRLKEEFGWKAKKIAEFYRCTPAWVGQLEILLSLSEKFKNVIHEGNMPVSGALLLAAQPQELQDELYSKAVDSDGYVSASAIKRAMRGLDEQAEKEAESEEVQSTEIPIATETVSGGTQEEEKKPEPTPTKKEKKVGKTTKVNRSFKEIKDFLMMQDGPGTSDSVRALCNGILAYMTGTITDKAFLKVLTKVTK